MLAIAVIIVLLIAAVYFIIGRFTKIAFLRDDRERTAAQRLNIPWSLYVDDVEEGERQFFGFPSRRAEIVSRDGLKLRATYVPCSNARATVIMMHGYRSDGFADFSTVFGFYRSMGFNILLPHQRSHLTSEGKYITFGIKERYDCVDWANYISREVGGDIWLLGVSMGAATVMMASCLNLPESVRGIIADCGFTSPWDQLAYVLKRDYGLPPFPVLNMVNRRFRRMTGVDLRSVSCADALKKCRIPVLFIHGGSDGFVPCEMSHENYESCASEKEIYVSDGADHAVTSWVDPRGYRDAVRKFIAKYA